MSAVLVLIAVGYLAGAAGWLRNARSGLQRARGLEHQGRPGERWHTLAAKDSLGALLFLGLAVVSVSEAADTRVSITDAFLVAGVGPMALALRLGRRFEHLSAEVAAIEDLAQRKFDEALQRDAFADRFAQRLAGAESSTPPEVTVRTLYQPVQGALGGDFIGVSSVGVRLDLVVGDVTGHGFDAALDAMRLKDLLLAELRAGQSPAEALTVANAFLHSEAVTESFATAFVAQYEAGVVVYTNAGHPPALIVSEHGQCSLPPTGPLLGVVADPAFDQEEVLLAPGQRLVAFTDGLIEGYGPAGGIDAARIGAIVRSGGIEGLQATISAARHEPVRDDIAMLELRRLPGAPSDVDSEASRSDGRAPGGAGSDVHDRP